MHQSGTRTRNRAKWVANIGPKEAQMLRASLYCSIMLLYPCVSFAQCPPPAFLTNQICLDQEGSIQDIGNGVRQRVFSLNKRTMDHVYPNVFWISLREWSIGNVGDPKQIIKQYPNPQSGDVGWPPGNTTRTLTWNSTYGTQEQRRRHDFVLGGLFRLRSPSYLYAKSRRWMAGRSEYALLCTCRRDDARKSP
jgi:hypothetical protein